MGDYGVCPKAKEYDCLAPGRCTVGDVVDCPSRGVTCAGDQCCPDGSTCPSAPEDYSACEKPKAYDCLSKDTSQPNLAQSRCEVLVPTRFSKHCSFGEFVQCPGNGGGCAGDQCCPDGSTCPSAHRDYGVCPKAKEYDCLAPGQCNVGDVVDCPSRGVTCAGDQCCPDGSTCPSAPENFSACEKPKAYDCLSKNTSQPNLAQNLSEVLALTRFSKHCSFGEFVQCPRNGGGCAGDQCCP